MAGFVRTEFVPGALCGHSRLVQFFDPKGGMRTFVAIVRTKCGGCPKGVQSRLIAALAAMVTHLALGPQQTNNGHGASANGACLGVVNLAVASDHDIDKTGIV